MRRSLQRGTKASREQNERKFGEWDATSGGGRIYRLEVAGRHGWRARFYRLVDAQEQTLRLWQEIFDEAGNLREVHEKFPVDTGHRPV